MEKEFKLYYETHSQLKYITTLGKWEKEFIPKRNWKRGYSACSLAEFITQRDGISKLKTLLSNYYGNVKFESGIVEKSISFDEYRPATQRDLFLEGTINENEKIIVSIEAKVNEDFSGTIHSNIKKQKHDRIPRLVKRILNKEEIDSVIGKLPYQLFHLTAGTLSYEPDKKYKRVVLILVLQTKGYKDEKGKSNDYSPNKGKTTKQLFCDFITAISASVGKKLLLQENPMKCSVNIEEKDIDFIYYEIPHFNLKK